MLTISLHHSNSNNHHAIEIIHNLTLIKELHHPSIYIYIFFMI